MIVIIAEEETDEVAVDKIEEGISDDGEREEEEEEEKKESICIIFNGNSFTGKECRKATEATKSSMMISKFWTSDATS